VDTIIKGQKMKNKSCGGKKPEMKKEKLKIKKKK